jgi:lysophospholipase L1-like esterase
VGDSITQGGAFGAYVAPSYRYPLWKHAVDHGASYTPTGSLTGAYKFAAPFVPDYKSQTFVNVHEAHSAWQAAWANARVPLPFWAYNTDNVGSGTAENWTGQTSTYATSNPPSPKTYTGTTYIPDTVVLMMGINDLIGVGSTAAQTESDLKTVVEQYQAANANVRVHVASVLPLGTAHGAAATTNPKVQTLNTNLAAHAAGWSTGSSTVSFIDVRDGFNPNTMTSDNTHLNYVGERVVAGNFAAGLGIGPRDNTIGLNTRVASNLATEFNDMNTLPGITAGQPLYLTGTGWSDPTPGDSWITLNEPSDGSTSLLRSDWSLSSQQPYTIEARVQMIDESNSNNDFAIWSDDGTGGAKPGLLRIFEDKTVWGNAGPNRITIDVNDNTSTYHDFRVTYDGTTYAVWRDHLLIADGLQGDISAGEQNNLALGNYKSSELTHALLDYVGIQVGTAYAAPEPSSIGLVSCGAISLLAWRRFRRARRSGARLFN